MARNATVKMVAGWKKNFDPEMARETLEPLGDAIVADAKRMAPVDTGRLKGSISYEFQDYSDSPFGTALIVGADAPYAADVELGTRKMAAQPYLRPAVEKRR